MKSIFIFCLGLFLFYFSTVEGQNSSSNFALIKERPSLSLNDKKNSCYEVHFKSKIKRCCFSADSSYIYLYLSNSDSIYCYDYKKDKVIWKVNWTAPIVMECIGSKLLISKNYNQLKGIAYSGDLTFLDALDGHTIDLTVNEFSYFDRSRKYLFTKNRLIFTKNRLIPSIVELKSAKTIWSYPKDSSGFGGIINVLIENNGITLLSDKVYKILNDSGLQWTYAINSSDNKNINITEGYSTRYNLLNLTPIPPSFNSTSLGKRYGMGSNILKVDSSIFFADKESIISLNHECGKEEWKTKLPFSLTGRSELFHYGANIILVNTGACEINQNLEAYGSPYFAVFDSETGELKCKTMLSESKNSILYIKDDIEFLLFVFKDKIVQFNKFDYSIKDYVLTESQIKQFGYFQPLINRGSFHIINISEPYWTRSWRPLPQEVINNEVILYDTQKNEQISLNFTIPTQNGTLSFNRQFEDIAFLPFKQLGVVVYKNDSYNVIFPMQESIGDWNRISMSPYFYRVQNTVPKKSEKYDFEGYYHIIGNKLVELYDDGIKVTTF